MIKSRLKIHILGSVLGSPLKQVSMKSWYIVLVVFSLCCAACGSSSSAVKKGYVFGDTNCIRPGMREVSIRWGDWMDTTAILNGYEIDAQGRLFKYQASPYAERYLRDSIGTVDRAALCFYIDTVRKTFLRIQSLGVRAPHMRYIEYQNPEAQLSLRAYWDSRFQTYGSREFRAIFDSLSTLVPPRRE